MLVCPGEVARVGVEITAFTCFPSGLLQMALQTKSATDFLDPVSFLILASRADQYTLRCPQWSVYDWIPPSTDASLLEPQPVSYLVIR